MNQYEINEYYKLKFQYEEGIRKEKNKIIKLPGMTWKEKKREFKEFKPKCVNCKRSVGTIFKREFNKEIQSIFLKAMCGDRVNPCKLNMKINIGYFFLLEDILKTDEEELKELKNMIINEKNNLLFGFTSPEKAVENFEAVKEELNKVTVNHEVTFERYINIVDNKKKKENIRRVESEILTLIDGIKQLVKEYKKTSDTKYIKDAVDAQVKEMNKLLAERMSLVYSQSSVEFEDGECKLVQKIVTMKDLEENLGSNYDKKE